MKTLYLFSRLLFSLVASMDVSFTYNGFLQANLSLDGASYVRPDGILSITNESSKLIGHAFYPFPLQFKENQLKSNKNKSSVVTFSTTFVFAIKPMYPELGGHGFAFLLSSTKEPNGWLPNQYLGLQNDTNVAEPPSRFLAVEFDIVQNLEFGDINDNHVGVDISSLMSIVSEPAAYYPDTTGDNVSIILKSGDAVQAWVDYTKEMRIDVTLSPLGVEKPKKPLISFPVDISPFIDETMYVGFSASTGLLSAAHDILGWSFRIGGKAQDLGLSELPSLERPTEIVHSRGFAVGITFAIVALVFFVLCSAFYVRQRIRSLTETLEDWEMEFGARRFKYSEIHTATKGFGEGNVIGIGGFGKVYKGVIPSTGLEVAIKRVTHDSRQGMREFVAEILSLGQLRHRKLVQLHGWCRRQDELPLVYDYVPNGSLDKLLFSKTRWILTWQQRYKILIGVAQALLYLHEECYQLVIHRDLKPSNVLIDADLTPKLGDFGLARISEHGIHPQTTQLEGTLGYLAPELTKTGKATTSTDVYGYGALMLEVATGRRPIEPQKNAEEVVLMDWVRELHFQGKITQALDHALNEFNLYEVELVLFLGLLCTHPHPNCRPSMTRVVEVLLGDADLPSFPPDLCHGPAGVVTNDSGSYLDDSDPPLGRATSSKSTSVATSSKSTSISNFDMNISVMQGTSITF